jgi:hypothetical protein
VVPVHDLVVEGDDLVAATHGRSIWILDDLPAVRQHQAELDGAEVHLYEPRRAVQLPSRMGFVNAQGSARAYRYIGAAVIPADTRPRPDEDGRDTVLVDAGENRASGVTVLYVLRDPGEHEVLLTFLDAAGKEIRALKAAPGDEGEKKPEPGSPREPKPPRRPGINRFVWDMRHAPPAAIRIDPPKDEGPWAQAQGPVVPPGAYQVRLEVGGESRTASFEIAKDPRNRATQEDLEAQYGHAVGIWRRLSDLNEAVSTIRELKRQAGHWTEASEEIGTAARGVRDALTEVEVDLVQVDPKGSGRLSNPDKLDGKLRVLLMQATFPARPTEASVAVADELARRMDGALSRLDAILEGQVEEFNELVRRAAAPALAPRPSAAPTAAVATAADATDPVWRGEF